MCFPFYSSPTTHAKTGRTAQVFATQGGHTPKANTVLGRSYREFIDAAVILTLLSLLAGHFLVDSFLTNLEGKG